MAATADAEPYKVNATADSHFAWLRTRLAVERTMMAWVRTAVALIGFGFTIVQFFERLGGMKDVEIAARPQAPRYLGLALIGSGIGALLISLWQYRQVIAHLRSENFRVLAGIDGQTMHTPRSTRSRSRWFSSACSRSSPCSPAWSEGPCPCREDDRNGTRHQTVDP
jgi:putative membrane protein